MKHGYANSTYTNYRYLAAIGDRSVFFDRAMGTNIQRFHLTADGFGGRQIRPTEP